jgi:hypothetical protein
MVNKRLLGVWRTMHNRCYNLNTKSYVSYGGRGIVVSPCWHGADGFAAFLRDMGDRPDEGTIERIDNDGPYSPENCRWASRVDQAKNKRNTHLITANGETKHLAEWARLLGCSPAAILARLSAGMLEEDAVTKLIPDRPNAKLTPADAIYVRKSYPMKTAQALANELSVSKKTILNIIHSKTFADVVV